MKKRIAILGSTGSIGRQALDMIRRLPDRFCAEVLTAQSNKDLLIRQAMEFRPNAVVIGNGEHYHEISELLQPLGIKVFEGEHSLLQIVEMDTIDLVLNGLVGYAGFKPTVQAIMARKPLALANKESLVAGGALVSKLAEEYRTPIIPVDSEHSAIFQCMVGEDFNSVEKIILTASGGPFLNKDEDYLSHVSKEEALKHPNWSMGDKITIDSASLMNKGLEVIEAKWLFGLRPQQIEVIIHPQSVIHSLVQFHDGSLKAQMGLPDMRLPILYALGYPERLETDLPRFCFSDYPELTFEKPDLRIFRNLALAYKALEMGGNAGCILNAANEIAVMAFLGDKIGFLDIPAVVGRCLDESPLIPEPSMDDYEQTDAETRKLAQTLVKSIQSKEK